MVSLQSNSETASTSIAVEEVFSTTNSADPTFITVKYLFPLKVIIKQIAYRAKVSCKLDAAFLARLLTFLNCLAFVAFDFCYCMPINLMVLLGVALVVKFGFVVAHSAREKFQTSWTSLLASSFVVLTTHVWLWLFDFFLF